MGNRLTKLYTKTGDDGSTGLGDGSRIQKDDIRVEAFGTVDELNSFIGVIISKNISDEVRVCLESIQHDLFDIGSETCIPERTTISEAHVARIEKFIDQFNANLPALKEFILPAGGEANAQCHVARTVCRRLERRIITLGRQQSINAESLKYINRLSDLLFVLARICVRHEGGNEVYWQPGKNV